MIKIYGMPSCPDCAFIEEQVKNNPNFEVINIGAHVKNLKEFLNLRDNNSIFDKTKKLGYAGIPCFVLEDGRVTLKAEDVGLLSRHNQVKSSCSIDGKGC